MSILYIYRELFKPLFYLIFLLLFGTLGYYYIEGWPLIDSLYMTVISITTVGFSEVHPLDQSGKLFTIFLVMGGVVFYAIAINFIFKFILESNFKAMLQKSKRENKIQKLKGHYIIAGGGRMAFSIAQELERSGKQFVIIENNEESKVSVMNQSWLILNMDALQEESLVLANIETARGIASVLPTDADNLYIVLSARRLNPTIRIETRISQESSRSKMLQAGANKVVSPYVLGGLQIARSFLEPGVDEFLDIILDQANYEFEMNVIHLEKNDPNAGQMLRNTDYRKQGLLIIGIKDPLKGLLFAPHSDYILQAGQEIIVMGPGKEKPLE